MNKPCFEGWAALELFGHRTLAGFVQEIEFLGEPAIRIDVESEGRPPIMQIYRREAVFSVTPISQEDAQTLATENSYSYVFPGDVAARYRQDSKQVDPTLRSYGDGSDEDYPF